ncbi:MAG: hypothetical protein GY866_11855 [Proteobacteria bacterium]|nr:hypothetical protein [Pseudomonadota bacterium]
MNICITHDVNLYLIKEYYLQQRPEDYPVAYLEGVIVFKRNNEYYMVDHQTDPKLLKTP